jgi:hypothetical protein
MASRPDRRPSEPFFDPLDPEREPLDPEREPLDPEREPEPDLELPLREPEPLLVLREPDPDPDPELALREREPDPELLAREREPAPELVLREREPELEPPLDFEPELEPPLDFEPELRLDLALELRLDFEPELLVLSSLSSGKIKLLGFVCRDARLADGQALHQPLLLKLTFLGRQPAVLEIQFQLEQVPPDEGGVVQLAVGLVGHLLDDPGHAPDRSQREQENRAEQTHHAAPASSTNECGGSGPV